MAAGVASASEAMDRPTNPWSRRSSRSRAASAGASITAAAKARRRPPDPPTSSRTPSLKACTRRRRLFGGQRLAAHRGRDRDDGQVDLLTVEQPDPGVQVVRGDMDRAGRLVHHLQAQTAVLGEQPRRLTAPPQRGQERLRPEVLMDVDPGRGLLLGGGCETINNDCAEPDAKTQAGNAPRARRDDRPLHGRRLLCAAGGARVGRDLGAGAGGGGADRLSLRPDRPRPARRTRAG